MGEALYRKYRPKSLDDVVGQPHITKTLSTALKEGKISHGYLFSGPRGVGKTSIARILAHQVNDFAYGDARGSLDIIEIDAASNRRIDEIRDLRDKVHLAPVAGKYKVYIIDEVHMLTREAFNALLKTLEEPPAHVIFILATTEAHKLPETIVSRTQRHSFKPVTTTDVVSHLSTLAKKEGLKVEPMSLELIAEHGEGSFRDSISLLDQLSILGTITPKDVQQALGLPSDDIVKQILEQIETSELKNLYESLENAKQHGISAAKLSSRLIYNLKQQLLNGTSADPRSMLHFIEALLQVSSTPNPYDSLEVVLFDQCLSNVAQNPKKVSSPAVLQSNEPKKREEIPKPEPSHPKKSSVTKPPVMSPASDIIASQPPANLNAADTWQKVLDNIKKNHNTLYGVARMAEPTLDDGALVLIVPFAFHQKRLSAEKNSKIISDTLVALTGHHVVVRTEIRTKSETSPKNNTADSHPSDTLQTVTDIFGGGEVLES